jgi:hypothetical protein
MSSGQASSAVPAHRPGLLRAASAGVVALVVAAVVVWFAAQSVFDALRAGWDPATSFEQALYRAAAIVDVIGVLVAAPSAGSYRRQAHCRSMTWRNAEGPARAGPSGRSVGHLLRSLASASLRIASPSASLRRSFT